MTALSNAASMPGALPDRCPGQSTQRNATQLTQRVQDSSRKSCVPDAPNPVKNEVEVASQIWFSADFDSLIARVLHVDLDSERVTLSDREARARAYEAHSDALRHALLFGAPSALLDVATTNPVGWRFRPKRPAIPVGRQLEIAIAALATQEAREGGMEKAA
jgi:hypothetical protein